jgi:segregation and condensation protein A
MGEASYTVRLPVFEGPFDLLFHLIKKAELEIWSISIAEITEQYLFHLHSMKELNLEPASEFLVMAATLLRLKSKLLLPRAPCSESADALDDEENIFDINSPQDLFARLEEYRSFKEIAGLLQEKERQQQKIFFRSTGGDKIAPVNCQQSYFARWEGISLLQDIMNRIAQTAAAFSGAASLLGPVDDYSINERIEMIIGSLKARGEALPLEELIEKKVLWEVIITLIALLELTRQRRVQLFQERPFGLILVSLNSGNKGAEK